MFEHIHKNIFSLSIYVWIFWIRIAFMRVYMSTNLRIDSMPQKLEILAFR